MGSLWACPVFSDSEEGIISGLFGFKVGWGLVVKTGMESGAIVEGFDVMEGSGASLGHAAKRRQSTTSYLRVLMKLLRPLVTMDQLWTLATTWYPDTPKPWRRRFDAFTRELAASAAR